ncbi:SMC family ATPase, partial [Actinomyces sp. MRS3W]|uniref:AAA family ATPase n=1 Tax=Actinomyces sp. MRS3W TaxID=2800796 RepID=UPI0028FDB2DD
MRLHRLTITGVGPFPGTQTIDFDRFTGSGRFLLTGPTGSGKTTIIDAIVFALYGQVADADGSSKQRIRSTLVDPTDPSEVELVFSTSAGVYRILRTPEYLRPKRRGSGTTKQNASVKLWRLAAPDSAPIDEPVTRIDEAGREIRRIVGLDREQFTQTVVLPQGKFAQFLRSTSDERHALLRDVFGTGIFDAMQEELRRRNRAAEQTIDEARQRLRARAELLAPLLPDTESAAAPDTGPASTQGASTPPPDTPPSPTSAPGDAESAARPAQRLEALVGATVPQAEAIISLCEDAVETARAAAAPAEQALTAADRSRQEASAAVAAATALQARLDRRSRLLEEQQQLDATAAQDDADAARLEAARRAAGVVPVVKAARGAVRTAEDAQADAADSLAAAIAAPAATAEVRAELESARDAVAGLAPLLTSPPPT